MKCVYISTLNTLPVEAQGLLSDMLINFIRDFVASQYTQIKRLNPRLPFLVRPSMAITEPKIVARYGSKLLCTVLIIADYGGEAERVVENLTQEEIKSKLKELVDIGEFALKANLYPWQESSPKDIDCVDYDPRDFGQHHV